jgi:hypothetical protein
LCGSPPLRRIEAEEAPQEVKETHPMRILPLPRRRVTVRFVWVMEDDPVKVVVFEISLWWLQGQPRVLAGELLRTFQFETICRCEWKSAAAKVDPKTPSTAIQ